MYNYLCIVLPINRPTSNKKKKNIYICRPIYIQEMLVTVLHVVIADCVYKMRIMYGVTIAWGVVILPLWPLFARAPRSPLCSREGEID